ncbi:beta-1,3-galactosyltransferase 5-like [Stylophora pistillata]|uniref:beta-1,3-galactosyltransferase 5-like n=1 Tax=Stylophora pistillata TaxID=50429 RepID=UPI000C04D31C|nr:beta-1,3-galactosyltransferase 5-like [Stylophora pistillata]
MSALTCSKVLIGSKSKRLIKLITAAALVTVLISFVANLSAKSPVIPRKDCNSWKINQSQHKTTLISKTVCLKNYFLLVLVSSAPSHFGRRNLIRETWGTDKNSVPEWKTFFLVGQTKNQTDSDLLKTENNIHGDIIRANYSEHYWNQSLKVEMGFEWAARYCKFSYLLKADDDVLVNTNDLITRLQRASTPKNGLYLGKINRNAEVRRYGKFSVNLKEYAGPTFPDYCSGGGFVLSYDVVECMVPSFDVINPFRIDDVYVGILAHELGLIPVHHSWFLLPNSYYDDCYFRPNVLVQHRVLGQCLIQQVHMHSLDFYSFRLGSYY